MTIHRCSSTFVKKFDNPIGGWIVAAGTCQQAIVPGTERGQVVYELIARLLDSVILMDHFHGTGETTQFISGLHRG